MANNKSSSEIVLLEIVLRILCGRKKLITQTMDEKVQLVKEDSGKNSKDYLYGYKEAQ